MVEGVWNCERLTNIDLVPSASPLPRRGSLWGLTGAEFCVCRCGDVGCGDVIDRTISGPGGFRGGSPDLGPGILEVGAPEAREVEKLGVVGDKALGRGFKDGGPGL